MIYLLYGITIRYRSQHHHGWLDEHIEDNITEFLNFGRGLSSCLGVSTDDATSSKTVDWGREDLLHDVSWDSFLVAFVLDDPMGKVLGLVELLETSHGELGDIELVSMFTVITNLVVFMSFDRVTMIMAKSGFSSLCLSNLDVFVCDWVLVALTIFDVVHLSYVWHF